MYCRRQEVIAASPGVKREIEKVTSDVTFSQGEDGDRRAIAGGMKAV
jgi:hypothetical protein